MPRRPQRHFEVIKTKLAPRRRRSSADGRLRSDPWRRDRDREPAVEQEATVREEPEPPPRAADGPQRESPARAENDLRRFECGPAGLG